ncbi:unnamed protein product [Camellia sinensis]
MILQTYFLGTSLGNEFSTSSLANNGTEGSLAHSEIPTVYVSDTRSAEEGPHISVVSNSDGGFHIDNRSILLILGRRGVKFQSKPKVQIEREKPGADTSHPDAVESIPCPQQAQSIPSETEYMNEGSNLAFLSNNIVDFPSLRFDDSNQQPILWRLLAQGLLSLENTQRYVSFGPEYAYPQAI